ncbi:MAG: hypothetical protein R3C05_15420 [Pirellulaceae bacterium]
MQHETHEEEHSSRTRMAANRAAANAGDVANHAAQHFVKEPAQDLLSLMKSYARENPDVAACWAFTLGIIVGWKLKP